MLDKLWDKLFDYLQGRPYWKRVQPIAAFLAFLVASSAGVYEYIEWRYHLALPPELFLKSYIFRQILLGFATFTALFLVFRRPPATFGAGSEAHSGWLPRLWQRTGLKRLGAAALIVAVSLAAFVRLAPARVGRIRIRFLDDRPAVNMYALTYLLYELNKAQESWQFEMDFDPFAGGAELATAARDLCQEGDLLCLALKSAKGTPFIGITSQPLGNSSYWRNRDNVSVISIDRFADVSAPGVYEYLSYTLIVQSILIHLNMSCGGPPASYFTESRVASGDLFEFSPRRGEMQAQIMAGHLTSKDRALLVNCFGFAYMSTCSDLARLDWLRAKNVTDNLRRAFGVSLEAAPAGVTAPRPEG